MASIISLGINQSKLTFNEKGWANITIFVNDTTNEYGQNVSASMEQSKEEREQENPPAKIYVGNGRVVWTADGTIAKADFVERNQEVPAAAQSEAGRETPEMPF